MRGRDVPSRGLSPAPGPGEDAPHEATHDVGPDEAAFHIIVAKYSAGEDLFDPKGTSVVRVTLRKIPGGFRGRVEQIGPEGELEEEVHQGDTGCFDTPAGLPALRQDSSNGSAAAPLCPG